MALSPLWRVAFKVSHLLLILRVTVGSSQTLLSNYLLVLGSVVAVVREELG